MYLEKIQQLRKNRNYDRVAADKIADEMENELSPAEMWNYLRNGFSTDELLENLEFIAREADI